MCWVSAVVHTPEQRVILSEADLLIRSQQLHVVHRLHRSVFAKRKTQAHIAITHWPTHNSLFLHSLRVHMCDCGVSERGL